MDFSGEEVILEVLAPTEVTRADIGCRIQRTHLRLAVAGQVICDGELARPVDPEESSWNFESSAGKRQIVVTLAKVRPNSALKSAREWPQLWAG
mmetsp:Transcript_58803/g.127209  ORF Transcript_58803/g.127209 Transcript_58803/m.127209 type:complete len:94 (-) Transcript_58803:70-351(-)